MIHPVRVVLWLVEGTWRGCVDAVADRIPPDVRVALLHVTPSDPSEVAEAAAGALLGRAFPRRTPPHQYQDVADEAAAELLAAAASRLGRQDAELLHRQGRVEREVVLAVAQDVDLLVAARDGDRSHLGPRSLGPTTRFVVDHAPCSVLLVWPDQPPGIESIPLPPHEGHRPPGPR
jgi:nucleotide-binding universal stress UspA family protein